MAAPPLPFTNGSGYVYLGPSYQPSLNAFVPYAVNQCCTGPFRQIRLSGNLQMDGPIDLGSTYLGYLPQHAIVWNITPSKQSALLTSVFMAWDDVLNALSIAVEFDLLTRDGVAPWAKVASAFYGVDDLGGAVPARPTQFDITLRWAPTGEPLPRFGFGVAQGSWPNPVNELWSMAGLAGAEGFLLQGETGPLGAPSFVGWGFPWDDNKFPDNLWNLAEWSFSCADQIGSSSVTAGWVATPQGDYVQTGGFVGNSGGTELLYSFLSNSLFGVDATASQVRKWNLSPGPVASAPFTGPQSIADRLGTEIWVAGGFGGTDSGLSRFDNNLTTETVIAPLQGIPCSGVVYDSVQDLIWVSVASAGPINDEVWAIDPNTLTVATVIAIPVVGSPGLFELHMTYGAQNWLWVSANSKLHRIDPVFGSWTTVSSPVSGSMTHMADIGNYLYVSVQGQGVVRVDKTTLTATNSWGPSWGTKLGFGQLAVGNSTELWVSTYEYPSFSAGYVLRVDTTTNTIVQTITGTGRAGNGVAAYYIANPDLMFTSQVSTQSDSIFRFSVV